MYHIIEYTEADGWYPGPGFYVVGPEYDGETNDEYLAYTGPLDYAPSRRDAELIVAALNELR